MARISLLRKEMNPTHERTVSIADMSSTPASPWDPLSLTDAEFILSSQLERSGVANRTGEFCLLWAVFTDGIHTYCREVVRGPTGSLAYREVERWIFRPSSDAITSFSSLCELFGLDPRRLRRALVRFREHPSLELIEILTQRAA